MNITELARRVKIPTSKLREIIPQLGFDIGAQAIKIDDRVARKIIRKLESPSVREKYLNKKQETNNKQQDKQQLEDTKSSSTSAKATADKHKILAGETIIVKDLAGQMKIPVTKLILELMKNGVMASLNQRIDFETAAIIANDLGFEVEKKSETDRDKQIDFEKEKEIRKKYFEDDPKNLKPRPPVIVVMGHVDHGKTKLLDAIRQTNVIDTEAGGITQHIGAYQVTVPPTVGVSSRPRQRQLVGGGPPASPCEAGRAGIPSENRGQSLTFIDTPGHEAFSAMRSRGAQVADIAILIVAADDGVQPQTVEALSHIKSAGLPFIVAINKIDKENANLDKVKSDLSEIGLTPEDWGGKTICVEISAKQKINIDGLLDTLLLVYEMEKNKIQGNPNRAAVGTIIESHLDKGAGPVATCLVQTGSLNLGDTVKIGNLICKIRALKNWQGENIQQAGPSMPAQILGLKKIPPVGEILCEITDKKEIKKLTKKSLTKDYQLIKQTKPFKPKSTHPDETKEIKKINIILKADVFGSIEAILESLDKVQHPEVVINVIKQGLGNINQGDVEQAANLDALLVGFNVNAMPQAKILAQNKKVILKTFQIIYDLLDFLKAEVEKLLSPEVVVKQLGKIKILKIFRTEKNSQIIGGKVLSGKILPKSKAKIYRNNELIGSGNLIELQCNKEIVSESVEGQECGMRIEGFSGVEGGDLIEVYLEEEKERKLGV